MFYNTVIFASVLLFVFGRSWEWSGVLIYLSLLYVLVGALKSRQRGVFKND